MTILNFLFFLQCLIVFTIFFYFWRKIEVTYQKSILESKIRSNHHMVRSKKRMLEIEEKYQKRLIVIENLRKSHKLSIEAQKSAQEQFDKTFTKEEMEEAKQAVQESWNTISNDWRKIQQDWDKVAQTWQKNNIYTSKLPKLAKLPDFPNIFPKPKKD